MEYNLSRPFSKRRWVLYSYTLKADCYRALDAPLFSYKIIPRELTMQRLGPTISKQKIASIIENNEKQRKAYEKIREYENIKQGGYEKEKEKRRGDVFSCPRHQLMKSRKTTTSCFF